MLERFAGNGHEPCVMSGPPRSTYAELRKGSPGNSEYRLTATNPSVVTRRSHLPVRAR